MKKLQYYVDLEKATLDEDVGDMYDGQILLENVKMSMYATDKKELVCQFDSPKTSMDLGYLKCPVFCMFMYDYRNHVSEDLNDDILTVTYQFTDEQRKKMLNFGEYVLIVKEGNEFVQRVKKGLEAKNIGYSRDLLQYYSFNNSELLKNVHQDNSRIAFWKRQKYSYQQEYRFIAHTEVDDFLSIDIGNISDITKLVKTEELLNTYVQTDFVVKCNG